MTLTCTQVERDTGKTAGKRGGMNQTSVLTKELQMIRSICQDGVEALNMGTHAETRK